ncbi:MAG: flagellar biosynthesis protein FlgH [Methylophilaceae bacterium 17-44-8]|nr:MAG: flagellar biosynthesis protein FlgH [Methylophilales bacterium 28-44-11]OYZ01519.1 MAG: flagellar biosynthesis protein FlgH [Methylophilales bacterium 16-45-7]OZA05457.1 MAG: flagellar biosynthesis protein FlgH [Methylophilaceae bacterium 17-44-8]
MKHILLMVTFAMLGACSITPDSIVKQPMTARPQAAATPPKTGAIFNQAAYRPMFEDRRPRYVGDTVTVNIAENTSATKAGGSSASKDASVEGSITSFLGKAVPKSSVGASGSRDFEDEAAANSSNAFNGAVAATVIEVLPNGFLVVSGEKQISLDKGTEFVRFSGVVNPDTITIGNFVSSTKIADARIEYRTNSKIDAAEIASMFARFFLSISAL